MKEIDKIKDKMLDNNDLWCYEKYIDKISKEIERLKSNEKTLADLLDKEQKKNKKAIDYIKKEEWYLEEYDNNFINENVIKTTKLLEILSGGKK